MRVEQIATSLITPDVNQPRLSIEPEPLKELALSIRELGVLQPLIVFQHEDGFCLVDGHRRHAAANLLKLASIPAMVLPSRPDGDQLLLTQMAANCMRVDLKPTEKAIAYLRLKKSRNWSRVWSSLQVELTTTSASGISKRNRSRIGSRENLATPSGCRTPSKSRKMILRIGLPLNLIEQANAALNGPWPPSSQETSKQVPTVRSNAVFADIVPP